jgi:hypothetical protein
VERKQFVNAGSGSGSLWLGKKCALPFVNIVLIFLFIHAAIQGGLAAFKSAYMAISTGYELLDDFALKAFRVWRFRPGSPAKVKIPVSFIMPGGRVITELKVMKNPDTEEILTPFLGKGTVVRGAKTKVSTNAAVD